MWYRLVAQGSVCLARATNTLEPHELGSLRPWVICRVFEPLLRFQVHSRRVQPILEPSSVWLVYYLMYSINMKLRTRLFPIIQSTVIWGCCRTTDCGQVLNKLVVVFSLRKPKETVTVGHAVTDLVAIVITSGHRGRSEIIIWVSRK